MISQREVYNAFKDGLLSIHGIDHVYDNRVTGQLPEGPGGHPLPGVILQWRVPMAATDEPVSQVQSLDARVFRIQMRPFAAEKEILMDMTDAIIDRFTDMQIGRGVVKHAVDDEPEWAYQYDPELGRPYSVLYWRIATQ